MEPFTYHMPTRVVFGRGCICQLKECAGELSARKVLLVTGRGAMRRTGILDRVIGLMGSLDVTVYEDVEADPSVETVDECVEVAAGCDTIVALGGGSALDAAKAVSIVAGNGGRALDYISGAKARKRGPMIIAVPTTAGTGSEVTEVSVLTDLTRRAKKSFRSRHMYPAVALDDPELTVTMPDEVTAHTGLDALTHAIEALTSKRSQPLTDPLCMEAAKLVLGNIEKAYRRGTDMQARENMMLGALMAGYGITHAGAGIVHGLSYALWKSAKTPHGLACGSVLPHAMRYNLGFEGGKYEALARHCGFGGAEELIKKVEDVCAKVGAPARLAGLGVSADKVDAMLELGLSGSTAVNPRPTDAETLKTFINSMI